MRIAQRDALHVRSRRARALPGLHGLSDMPTTANPYPNGVPVSGQGPAGVNWQVDWSPILNTWVAHSPFGAFPLWTDANFATVMQQIFCTAPFNAMYATYTDGTNALTDLLGYYDQNNVYGGNICAAPLDFFKTAPIDRAGELVFMTHGPPCGNGSQTAYYTKDALTGWYVPSSAEGSNGCGQMSMLASFGIFVGLAAAVIGGAALLAPAAGAEAGGAAATTVATDVTASTVAPEVASFTVPEIAAPAVVDVSATVPVDIASTAATVGGAASPLSQAFNVANYIKQLAGAYSTVQSLTQLTGGAAVHPQAGTLIQLPDGSTARINADGSTTVLQPNGTVNTIGAGGTISNGPVPIQAGGSNVSLLLLASAALGFLLT
jgi:hypothetical protein